MPVDAGPLTSRVLEDAVATATNSMRAAVEEELAVQRSELECRGRALDQREQKLNQLQADLERREQQLLKSGVEIKASTSPCASADGVLRGRVQSTPTPSRGAEGRCAEAPVSWTCQQGAEDEGTTGTAKAVALKFSKLTKPEGGAAAASRAQPQGEALLADTFAGGPTTFAVQEPAVSSGESPPRGSASKLKAMFEQKVAASKTVSAPAADGERTARRTCPPTKGKSLQDLLKADEACQRTSD